MKGSFVFIKTRIASCFNGANNFVDIHLQEIAASAKPAAGTKQNPFNGLTRPYKWDILNSTQRQKNTVRTKKGGERWRF